MWNIVEDVTWNYNDAPEVTSGINPEEMAFEGDFKTFVREAIQNSNDAVLDQSGQVIFELKEFEGKDLKKYRDAVNWKKHSKHLKGAAKAGMKKVDKFINSKDPEESIRVLKIEDRGCEGLNGGEEDKESNYYALTKSVGLTNKSEDSSGGSYGMGKSVYSKFSRAGTVIYNSNPSEMETKNRLLGRTMLIDHETSEGEFLGRGLFGKYNSRKEITESVRGDDGRKLADLLGAEHTSESPGTSISIMGFSDPKKNQPRDPETIKAKIKESAAKYFWPAIESQEQRLNVYVQNDTNPVKPSEMTKYKPYVQLLNAYENQEFNDELENKGDIVKKTIEAEVPKHRDEGQTEDSEVDLVIRLGEEGQEMVNRLAMFRGSKMIVEYDHKQNWGIGGRPFQAILVCGEARLDPDQGDKDMEQFLKTAEPPEHNEWISTPKMSDNYIQPYKKKLNGMKKDVDEALRESVMRNTDTGEIGAEKLSAEFPFGNASGDRNGGGGVSFKRREADLVNGQWKIHIEAEYDEQNDWGAEVELKLADEKGKSVKGTEVEIESCDTDQEYEIRGNKCIIFAEKDEEKIEFDLYSVKIEEKKKKDEALNLKTSGRIDD